MGFREDAVAAYRASLADARQARVQAARAAVVDVLTVEDGGSLLDAKSLSVMEHHAVPQGAVVLSTPDSVHFLVRDEQVELVELDGDRWVAVEVVRTPADVGRALSR